MTWPETVFITIGYCVMLFAGYLLGWHRATIDTERRWSDAVKRADDARARDHEYREGQQW